MLARRGRDEELIVVAFIAQSPRKNCAGMVMKNYYPFAMGRTEGQNLGCINSDDKKFESFLTGHHQKNKREKGNKDD
jgi:hypothetical protein